MCSENLETIKELVILEFDKQRSKNKEFLDRVVAKGYPLGGINRHLPDKVVVAARVA